MPTPHATPHAPHASAKDRHLALLMHITALPTAAGREWRVVDFIRQWAKERPDLTLAEDPAGNLVIAFSAAAVTPHPLFITAHLDHPAFVIERIVGPGTIELSFRGGVMDVFFQDAPIVVHTRAGRALPATLTGKADAASPAGTHYLAEFSPAIPQRDLDAAAVGDVATWLLLGPEIDESGILHTPACDDLAALAAALAAMDDLRDARALGRPVGDVRLLLTRAEEIGFVGAIAACRHGTMPAGARVIALENSRAFPESPVGGGPIVRVGDRISVFTPWLTSACAARAEELFASPAQPMASQTQAVVKRKWQRKLMAGGACEASVFCHAGYDATCLCLPLGNYHNMPHLAELQAGAYDAARLGPPRAAREFIHTDDFLGLVDLLAALGQRPPEPQDSGFGQRLDRLYAEKAYVLAN